MSEVRSSADRLSLQRRSEPWDSLSSAKLDETSSQGFGKNIRDYIVECDKKRRCTRYGGRAGTHLSCRKAGSISCEGRTRLKARARALSRTPLRNFRRHTDCLPAGGK
jgi:hypothetical protein